HREADRAQEALAERIGRNLDAVGVPVRGVAGRLGAPQAQGRDVLDLGAESAEAELGVLREARATRAEARAGPPERGWVGREDADGVDGAAVDVGPADLLGSGGGDVQGLLFPSWTCGDRSTTVLGERRTCPQDSLSAG